MKQIYTLSLILLLSISVKGQNVKILEEGQDAGRGTIQDVTWIAGHWMGDMGGNTIEEIWTDPAAGAMMGSFRMSSEESVMFYELMTINEVDGSLLLKIKHFNADFTGWEEKDESVEFPLVSLKENEAYFSGLTFKKVSDEQLDIYVNQESGDQIQEMKFTYKIKR